MSNIRNKDGRLRCSVFKRCGGCQLDMPYTEQLEWKQKKADRMLSRFCRVEPIIPMKQPYHYRNKVQTVYRVASGRVLSGVFSSSTRTMTAADECLLEDKRAANVIKELKKLLLSFKIFPYDERTGRGILRHTLIRTSHSTGEVMLVLVTKGAILPSKNNFARVLKEKCPEVTTLIHNINPDKMPLTLGERSITLFGKGSITDNICSCDFIISPQSFYQVNPVQTEKLYRTAVSFAEISQGSRVIDAYCGVGTIGIVCAKNGADVTGIEKNPSAVKDAVKNAELNGLDNISFMCADATQALCEMAYKNVRCDVVIMDPPRAGSTQEFISAVSAISPERVVYVSCGIETLERDIRIFGKTGYKAVKIQPVDMFAHTTGIETVVLLKKCKGEI